MKKQYLEPKMLIEVFGDDIVCNGNGWGFPSMGDGSDRIIIEELEDM